MSVPPLAGLEGQGHGSLVGGGSPVWIPYTFSAGSSTVQGTHPHGFLFTNFHQGDALEDVTLSCRERGGRTSPSSFSRLLQPDVSSLEDLRVIDLSVFNSFVFKTPFKMETIRSVLLSVRQGDWMASIDLKEAYLQFPGQSQVREVVAFGKLSSFRLSASASPRLPRSSPGL